RRLCHPTAGGYDSVCAVISILRSLLRRCRVEAKARGCLTAPGSLLAAAPDHDCAIEAASILLGDPQLHPCAGDLLVADVFDVGEQQTLGAPLVGGLGVEDARLAQHLCP